MTVSVCHYCFARIGPRRVAAESHGDHALCVSCASHVELVYATALVERLGREATPTDTAQEFRWMVPAAREFLAGVAPSDDRESVAFAKWTAMGESPPETWLPIACYGVTEVRWGEVPRWVTRGEIDGRHRLALAVALNRHLVRCCPARKPLGAVVPGYTYQTLAFPDGFVHGERTLDRFALWPRVDLDGKRIVELACATGVDGTLLVMLGARSYYGIDLPANAALAACVAEAWGVGRLATFAGADLTTELPPIPPSDVAWILSSAIQVPMEVHLRAVRGSGARLVFIETHREEGHVDDEPSRALMAALPVRDLDADRRVGI